MGHLDSFGSFGFIFMVLGIDFYPLGWNQATIKTNGWKFIEPPWDLPKGLFENHPVIGEKPLF